MKDDDESKQNVQLIIFKNNIKRYLENNNLTPKRRSGDVSSGDSNIFDKKIKEIIFINNHNNNHQNNKNNFKKNKIKISNKNLVSSSDRIDLDNNLLKSFSLGSSKINENEKLDEKTKTDIIFQKDIKKSSVKYNSLETNRIKKIQEDIQYMNQQGRKLNIQCIFCEKFFNNNKYFSNFKCKHYFCKECGKNYYSDLIKQGFINNFKCPIFKCQRTFNNKFIEHITSLTLSEHSKKNNSKKIIKNKDIIIINNKSCKKRKNIIDINNNGNFYKYIKLFSFECPLCKEISLYGKIKGPYFKCLKCFRKYCKYCREELNMSHFDLSSKGHCKVFYRIRKKNSKTHYLYYFFKYLLFTIGAYLFLISFFIIKLKKSFRYKNIAQKIFSTIFFVLLTLIIMPFLFLLIPYFPIINAI